MKLQDDLSEHANFQTFGNAFMTMVRSSTGEAWNSIMIDVARSKSPVFECDNGDFDYDRYVANGCKYS